MRYERRRLSCDILLDGGRRGWSRQWRMRSCARERQVVNATGLLQSRTARTMRSLRSEPQTSGPNATPRSCTWAGDTASRPVIPTLACAACAGIASATDPDHQAARMFGCGECNSLPVISQSHRTLLCLAWPPCQPAHGHRIVCRTHAQAVWSHASAQQR